MAEIVKISKFFISNSQAVDLVKIEEWGRSNIVEFNARKTQCYLLSHKQISDPGQNVCMGGMQIVKSETLDVLGQSIPSDVR